MRVTLDVLHGPRKGRTFVFDSHDTFIVGRSRFVHCPIPEDTALSRDHFLIEINPPRCELRDLGSTNGTFVNERRVDRSRLGSGDQIVAGQSVFRVRVDGVPTHVGEVRSPTGSRIGRRRWPSTGCRSPAPAAASSPRPTSTWPATRARRWRGRSCGGVRSAAPRSP